jgi:hypothetical protein
MKMRIALWISFCFALFLPDRGHFRDIAKP